jgi:hypothetical protein
MGIGIARTHSPDSSPPMRLPHMPHKARSHPTHPSTRLQWLLEGGVLPPLLALLDGAGTEEAQPQLRIKVSACLQGLGCRPVLACCQNLPMCA